MKVVVWNAAGYPGAYVTGVGKHVRHMVDGLAGQAGWDVKFLVARDHARAVQRDQANSPLGRIPFVQMPLERRAAEALWRTTAWPPADRWAEDADWIYCPRELYVPVRNASYAVTVHDLYLCEPSCPEKRFRHCLEKRFVLRRAFEEADVLLAISQFTKERLVALFRIDPKKIRVVGNGVEAGFFDVYQRDPQATSPFPGKTYVLSVGGLTRKKGAVALLNVAEILRRIAPNVELVVAGPVEAAFLAALRRQRNVRSLERGFPDIMMHALVRGAEALVTLSEYEGFGIPVIEAMAAGVPVIAARRAALPEVVGDAGVLVEPTRTGEVAGIVHDVLRDEAWRNALIAKGRLRAREFTWSHCVARLAAALTENRPLNVGLQAAA